MVKFLNAKPPYGVRMVSVMETIEIPKTEYRRLQEELALLKDNEFLKRVNKLVDYLYQDKYGLYIGEYTGDLTEQAVDSSWKDGSSVWDDV